MERVISRPIALFALLSGLTLPLGVAAARLETDNTLPAWLPPGDPALADYERFQAVFGAESFALVALDGIDAASEPGRRALGALAARLRARPDVARVVAPWDEEGRAVAGPATRHLVARDGGMAALLVLPRAELDARARAGFMGGLERELASGPGRPLLAGPEAINHALDEGSRRSFGTLFPLALAVVSAVVALALRSWRALLAIQLAAGLACAWTLGALELAGRSLNLVVVVLPALLVVIGTAYAMHVVTRFLAGPAPPPGPWPLAERRRAWARAARETAGPCLLTALTTAAGFLSLASAGLPALRDLGLFAAAGVLASCGLALTLVPTCLALSERVRPRPAAGAEGSGAARRWVAWLEPRAGRVALGCVLGVALLATGIGRLRVESHVLRYLSPAHPLVAATAAIESRLVGLTPLEVWVEGPLSRVASAEAVTALRALPAALRDDDLLGVISPLEADPRLSALPARLVAAEVRRRARADALPPEALPWVRALPGERLAVRITLLCRTTSSERTAALAARLRPRLAAALPADLPGQLTGAMPLLVELQAALLRAQVRSFAASLGLVALVLLAWLRSPGLVALSLVPNALPIAVTLGAMGFLGLPLDLASVTVAGIALGLVVDDTIHLLHAWREARAAGAAPAAAAVAMLERVGRPVLVTSGALALGFLTFAPAPFRPTRDFGLLVAGTATGALLLDLVLTPALLLWSSRARRGEEGAQARRYEERRTALARQSEERSA